MFLLGECGDIVQDAPYALEKLIDNYENIKYVTFKYNLLNATMKNGCLLPVSVSFVGTSQFRSYLAGPSDDDESRCPH